MTPWIQKHQKELKSLYYLTHISSSGMTSIPSKSISFEDWTEYAEAFKYSHLDFINIDASKMMAKSEKYRIVSIIKKNTTTYQIQKKYKLFGWIKKRIVFRFLDANFENPNIALDFYNVLELKK